MEKIELLVITLFIFLLCIFLFWKLFKVSSKKEYGSKMWKHWPTQLSLWQAVILYSSGLTAVIVFGLKGLNILNT
jgi:hypothetical protein